MSEAIEHPPATWEYAPAPESKDVVRIGERAVSNGMEQVQHGVDRLIDRLGPVRKAREEMSSLRTRLVQLETSLSRTARAGTGSR